MFDWVRSVVARWYGQGNHAVARLVDRVVARSLPSVERRCSKTLTHLSPEEARGYIRARAAIVIRREIGIATACGPLPSPITAQRVFHLCTDQLVARILSAQRQRRTAGISYRRAA